jgi:hypothetical protein
MTDQNSSSILLGVIVTVAGQVITLLTLMFNARQSRLREERARMWLLEDRAALAKNTARAETAADKADKAYSDVIATISALNATLLNHGPRQGGPPP